MSIVCLKCIKNSRKNIKKYLKNLSENIIVEISTKYHKLIDSESLGIKDV